MSVTTDNKGNYWPNIFCASNKIRNKRPYNDAKMQYISMIYLHCICSRSRLKMEYIRVIKSNMLLRIWCCVPLLLIILSWISLIYLVGVTMVGIFSNTLLSWEFDRYDIVEGEHSLWKGVSKPYRETIRAFLAYFQNQVNNVVPMR